MVRRKNRYIVLELVEPSGSVNTRLEVSEESILSAVTTAVSQIHGEHGLTAVRQRLILKYCNAATRVALLRVSHAAHPLLASALPFVTSVGHQPVTPRTLYTGATIMHCFKFLRRYQESQLERVWHQLEPHQRASVTHAFATLSMPNTLETRALPGAQV